MGAKGGAAAGHVDRAAARSHLLGGFCLIATVGMLLVVAPLAVAAPTSFTWAGRSTITEEWSEANNWEADVAPTAPTEISTLTFPRLTSTACTLEEELHPCYISYNDVTGLSAEALHLDDGDEYLIGGEDLTLGVGGLRATPAGSTGEGVDYLELPFTLSAAQQWVVAGRNTGLVGENGVLLTEGVTGTGKALTVQLEGGSALYLAGNTEVGPLAIEGADASEAGVFNGFAGLLNGELNASNAEPVNLSHIDFIGDGAVGKLTTDDAEVDIGSGLKPSRGIRASSVKLDAASDVDFEISSSGSSPQEDYSQLTSNGPIALEGSALGILVAPPKQGEPCPVLAVGQSYTFISTTGTLSGHFANAPEHGAEIPIEFAKACAKPPEKIEISYHETSGTETVTGTVEAAVKQRQEEEAQQPPDIQRLNEEFARKAAAEVTLREAAVKRAEEEDAAAAAAKKHQEEELGNHQVLAEREASPDAVTASASLEANASGAVRITIRCPVGVSSCAGTVTLRTLGAVRGAANAKPARLTLATGSFAVPGGGAKTFTLHLSAKARALLARSHELHVRATILAHNPTGGTHTGEKALVLRSANATAGKH
jgi:hypothetical protein